MKRFIYPGVHDDPIEVEPGIYQAEKVPFETYLRWNAVSNSSLGAAIRDVVSGKLILSMAHYRDQGPVKETPEMRFGTMAHAAKFEFLKALNTYDVMPDFMEYREKTSDDTHPEYGQLPNGTLIKDPCRTADGKVTTSANAKSFKDRVAKYKSRPDKIGKLFVTQDEIERLAGVLAALDRNQLATEYFQNNGPKTDYELCIVWRDPMTGILCKGRIDCAQHELKQVNDLKTSENAAAFERTIARFGYHRQGAFYADGLQVLTGEIYRPGSVIVERDKPHSVRAAPFGFSALSTGRSHYRQILDGIAKAIESRTWAGLESPDEWQIPAYAMENTMSVADGVLTSF